MNTVKQLYQKYEDIFEQRFSHPVRGMIDAGNDAGIIIVGEMEAHILAQAPLDWSTHHEIATSSYRFLTTSLIP